VLLVANQITCFSKLRATLFDTILDYGPSLGMSSNKRNNFARRIINQTNILANDDAASGRALLSMGKSKFPCLSSQ